MKLQDDLDRINEWSTRWKLPFNVDKCKSLHIGRKNKRHCYEMEGKKLEQVTEENFNDDEFTSKLQRNKKGEWRLRPTEKIIHITRQNNTTSPV